jgi:transcription initiation factor TFIID subunit 7
MTTQKLTLKIGKPSFSSAATPSTSTPIVATPGGTNTKIKFKTNSAPSTPAPSKAEDAPKPTQTKAGRVPKASAKVRESKKRVKEESDTEEEGSTIQVQAPPAKRLKVTIGTNSAGPSPSSAVPKTPGAHLKVKVKGKPPKRELGEGYDSEASDREDDPTIEEQFVLRMHPGDDCDYLRQAIAEKKIGLPKNQGGPDIHMKFYADDQNRRASISIRGRHYAAIMVDLPCVIEGMKSWDKRGWWKSADICQMLWVYKEIGKEEEAKNAPLPKIVDAKTYQYPHGLTPPMHYARKRRFRKRISRTAIEAVEDAVEKLLAADAAADSSTWEMIQPDNRASIFSEESEGEYDDDEDAEGEVEEPAPELPDYFSSMHHANGGEAPEIHDAELEADLEAAFEEESLAATPVSTTDATPMVAAETPVAEAGGEEDSGDESIEGDDDDEEETGGMAEVDEDQKARQMERQGVLEEIADLERSLATLAQNLANQFNPILKRRLEESIRKTQTELNLKKSSIEDGD